MNIQIERDRLFPLIGQVQGILEKKRITPIHSYILLDVEKEGQLKVFASGGELSFLGKIPCKVGTSGCVAIDGKKFFDILREIPSGIVSLVEEKNRKLRIKTKNSTFHVFGLNPDDFLVFAPIEAKKFQKIPVENFLDIIEKTLFCVSLDESRYHLTGVLCESFKETSIYRFASTDGHRMAFFDLSLKGKGFVHFNESIIIPRKGLQEIKRLISLYEEKDVLEFAVEKSRVVVKFRNQILFIRLIDGKFPPYQALLPKDKGKGVAVNREDFLSALRRVSVLTNERFKAVNFLFKDGKLKLEVFVPEVGEGTATLNCDYREKNEEIKIRFNSRYILDIVSVLDEREVQMFLKGSSSAGVIIGKGSQNYTTVVMPMTFPKEERKNESKESSKNL